MEVYHQNATATVAPAETPARSLPAYDYILDMSKSPFAFDRLCDELCRQAEIQGTTTIIVSHRTLAEAINCSATRIPSLMKRLEDRGQITREPFKNSYQIDVSPLIDQTDRSGVIDQSEAPQPLIDQSDRSGVIDQGMQATTPLIDQSDRSVPQDRDIPRPTAADRDPTAKRVKNVCMESLVAAAESHDSAAAETSRARAKQRLAELGADDKIISDALKARPDLTVEQINATWAHFQARVKAKKVSPDSGAFFTAIRHGRLHAAPPDPAAEWHALAPPDAPEPPGETLHECARRLCPDDASGHEFTFLLQTLASGASDADAVAALHERRKGRQRNA